MNPSGSSADPGLLSDQQYQTTMNRCQINHSLLRPLLQSVDPQPGERSSTSDRRSIENNDPFNDPASLLPNLNPSPTEGVSSSAPADPWTRSRADASARRPAPSAAVSSSERPRGPTRRAMHPLGAARRPRIARALTHFRSSCGKTSFRSEGRMPDRRPPARHSLRQASSYDSPIADRASMAMALAAGPMRPLAPGRRDRRGDRVR